MPALDFTAMMSAAAALERELAAKDARIAELEAACAANDAYIAKLEPANSAYMAQLKEVFALVKSLAAENEALKTQVAALDALVSARAASAEQQAYDDLSGSVLAEEAYAAAQAAQAEEVLDLTGESEGEAAPAAEGGAAPKPKKQRAEARSFAKLAAVLPEGTPLSIVSTGDRWDGVYTKDGLVFQDKAFKSPQAVTKAHAERITERHPKATQPGSGWLWLKIENGAYKGKTLGQAYDAHYSA
jgi:hypothetical protein